MIEFTIFQLQKMAAVILLDYLGFVNVHKDMLIIMMYKQNT